jgi:alkanesulfonate monooxygenase SsuD/methylene tetrahydromethanopterin reductase-like flavin-dependent oxidoreductase (luciferase family)
MVLAGGPIMEGVTTPSFGVMHDFSQQLPLTTPPHVYYGECLDLVVTAERAGFDAVWMSEHPGRADGFAPSPLVAAAAIAARTSRIRIGTNVVLLPLHHPLQVAEDGAVVHAFSGGRLVLGVGQGYSPHEFGLFGVQRTGRTERFEEGIEIIRRAWRAGRTGYDGRRFSLPDGPFSPQPPAHAPIYVGAVAPAAVDRGVRLADGLLVDVTAEEDLYGRYETYTDALERAGRKPETFPFVWTSVAHVSASAEEAWAEAGPTLAYLEDQLRIARGEEKPITVDDLDSGAFLVGSPAEVAARLRAIRERAPFDHFAFWGRLPGLSAEQAARATELFAAEVIPAVQAE